MIRIFRALHAFPLILCSLLSGLFISCGQSDTARKIIVVENLLDLDRSFETIELTKESLGLDMQDKLENFGIRDRVSQASVTTQYMDSDSDGLADILLFQPVVDAMATREFELFGLTSGVKEDTLHACYSRFVPERTDDYAWENNRVAFRTYGPTAQNLKEEGKPGGTLSSGIDAWLKKIDYPIINKWYEKETTDKGSYHEDTGEGLDNFHVGASRGIGGTAVKRNAAYYFSKNFTSWRTIATGPIRTSFILDYAGWDAAGNEIKEEKHISLDYGSNLSKFEISIQGVDTLSVGLTLHENDGETTINEQEGWLSYWQPHEESELGSGIVVPGGSLDGYEKYVTEEKDLSNLYAHIKVKEGKVSYYAGFAWKESVQYETKEEWVQYLTQFARRINTPLSITIK
ncbi:MAG: DUF4861 family protein [Saprospiraceae bacterium]|nr:DUF4861 family protein [Saprospiraceae bacterium]